MIKIFIRDFIQLFLNYFIANIPCWFIRRILYRMLGMTIGKGTRICMKCIVMSPWKIVIGENTMINEHVLLDGRGGLQIGNSCSISMYAVIYSASHYSWSNNFKYYSKETKIENCCWIGTRAVINSGSVIKERTIISVNSSYKGVSEVSSIYAGVPAKKIGDRKLDTNYTLNNTNFFK